MCLNVKYVHCLPCFRLEYVIFKYSILHHVTQSFDSGFSQLISEYFIKVFNLDNKQCSCLRRKVTILWKYFSS